MKREIEREREKRSEVKWGEREVKAGGKRGETRVWREGERRRIEEAEADLETEHHPGRENSCEMLH